MQLTGIALFVALAVSLAALPLIAQPLILPPRSPVPLSTIVMFPKVLEKRGDHYFADFGKAAYGNLQIIFPEDHPPAEITVRLGEKLDADNQIDRKPSGSISYQEIKFAMQPDERIYTLKIPLKERHNNRAAMKMPREIGNVTPFRYAEIEGSVFPLEKAFIRQLVVRAPFDEEASAFQSNDATLNTIWDLCKYTMQATTAFGVYIDGERERIPYEADTYINQLSHYAVDLDPQIARYTFSHLLRNPTWPTEWSLHMPMIAHADYQATGNPILAKRHFEDLKKKLLMDKAREDGLLRAGAIVDWPEGERDDYNEGKTDPNQRQQVGPEINTVTNAFYYRALKNMETLAHAIEKEEEARVFATKAQQVHQSFNKTFFDPARGLYTDGEGSNHVSLHANMFSLAFDLVPAEHQKSVADFIQSRGMACSPYGAQYLMEALYKAGRDDYAMQLLTAKHDRSWWHMIELGSTITLEAWDARYKPNLTWNHAWGAAPANIITRFVLGVRPLSPGYEKILISPQPGSLTLARGKVPTARGPVRVSFAMEPKRMIEIEIPRRTTARLEWPNRNAKRAFFNGKPLNLPVGNSPIVVDNIAPGKHVLELD